MRKPIYFLCLLLIVVLITGCSRINNIIKIEEERIGVEYTGFDEIEDGVDVDSNGTRGEVKNYESNLNENIWTTQFDYMNGTDVQAFTIENDDILKN